MATTLIQEFHQGMRTHFGIQNSGDYIDLTLIRMSRKVHIDPIKFDSWLHDKHGEYELERNMSMANLLLEHYGSAAYAFVNKFL
jgi:hypothetical protein